MTVAERVANESKLFIDVYVAVVRSSPPGTPGDRNGAAFKAQGAVEAYRFWLNESGYVDLDATE
jgi:hypothetical protein